MISIIICSRKADISEVLKQNIAQTIGCEYEVCVIDNSRNEYSIFSAYNEGVRRAKGDILCFMHDDIRQFHTNGWGKNIEKHFAEDDKLGLIGVQGTHFIPNTPFEWYRCYERAGVIMEVENSGKQVIYTIKNKRTIQSPKELINEVVAVDGVFFCMTRKMFDVARFDSETFSGWDFYDMDICMQVREVGYKVGVVYDVIIEHPWYGTYGVRWKEAGEAFYQKWQSKLPQIAGITMTDDDVWLHTDMARNYTQTLYELIKVSNQLDKTTKSRAYRIGKVLLSPFNNLRKVLCKKEK